MTSALLNANMPISTPLFVTPTSLTSPILTRRQTSTGLSPRRLRFVCRAQHTPEQSPHGRSDDPSGSDDETTPGLDPNWREFRAALVAGSVARHQELKRNAYRTGHWAHPVSLPLHLFLILLLSFSVLCCYCYPPALLTY